MIKRLFPAGAAPILSGRMQMVQRRLRAFDRSPARRRIVCMLTSIHVMLGFLFSVHAGAEMSTAQDLPGDVEMGLELAASVCSDCHSIESELFDMGAHGVPPFQSIADNPTMTPRALQAFLGTPHRNTPDLNLSVAERDDVIAYIVSLRRR